MDPKLRSKNYNPNMDLELDPELTPTEDLRYDIEGTGAGAGVDPKLK